MTAAGWETFADSLAKMDVFFRLDINCRTEKFQTKEYFMRKSIFAAAFMLALLAFATAASAQKQRFVGTFVPEDPKTGGITRLTLGENDMINVWGRCHPTDCDWGSETAFAYAPSVGSELQDSAQAMTAIYKPGFAIKILVIKPLGENKLRVDVFTRFTDCGKRTAYTVKQVLVREQPTQ